MPNLKIEFTLLGLLALLWGSSYLFIKVAVAEIPPLTLIAVRCVIATWFLACIMYLRRESLPSDNGVWGKLLIQSFLGSIGAWTVLAWGQQFVDSGLASVLNSTSPIFVFLFTVTVTRHEQQSARKLVGALVGITGVVLIVGTDVLAGLGTEVAGQLACLAGAMLYGCAAIYGRRFKDLGALATATGTLIWACVVLVPIALYIDQPWTLRPSYGALVATVALSLLSTGLALLIYFRLIQTLGSLGVTSQSYLRAGVGVVLGMVFLGETLTVSVAIGLSAAILGVVLINWPQRE